jgi:hypothetical protein
MWNKIDNNSSRKYNINGVKLTEEQFIATVRDMKLKELIDG